MNNYDFNQLQKDVTTGKFPLIGKGSSRKVYDLNNGFIVKIAMNEKGIQQNKTELEIYTNDSNDFYAMELFARIEAHSDDCKYLVVEKCIKVKSMKQVKTLLYDDITPTREEIECNFIDKLTELENNYSMCPGDLKRASSWGLTENGNVVLIDYGLTWEVYNKYYSWEARRKQVNNRMYAYNY